MHRPRSPELSAGRAGGPGARHKLTRITGRFDRSAALLLALAALFCAGNARGGEAAQPAVLTLILNEVNRGETIVILRGKDVWALAADLRAAGLHGLRGRSETLLGKPYVSLASLSPLRFAFDERALTLRISAPPELLPTALIDMSPPPPSDIVHRRDMSAFLNYTASLADFSHPSGFVEAGVSVDGVLFSSTASASPQTGVVRGLSSLVVDERRSLQRFTLGDSFVTSGPLGAGLFLGGLSVSKSFELDPYLIHQPSLGYAGSALTPSKLDIYVNGAFVRSEAIAPGSFQVQNLPVTAGSGDVRYVLRDAFGRERAVASPYSMAASQLAKGQSDYTYALGFRRQRVGQASFDYGAPVASGHHRVGLTDRLTVGARIEASRELLSGGSTLQVLVPFGYVNLSAAASSGAGGAGLSGAVAYGFSERRVAASATLQALSNRYSTLSLDSADDRGTLEASVMTSIAATPRLNLASSYLFILPRDAPSRFRLGVSLTMELTKSLHLVCMVSRSVSGGLRASGEASAVLTYSIGGGVMASAGAKLTGTGPAAFVEANRPAPASGGFGFRASGTAGQHPAGSAVAHYQGPYGRYQTSLSVDDGGSHLMLEANGALVALEGAGVFAAPPVQGGFAVIRVPGVKGVRGYLDNREIGTTSASGDLVIPNLLPYYGNRLRISDEDLPLDYSLGATEVVLAPPHRGGALAIFSAQRVRYYRGRALVKIGGAKTPPVYGEIAVATGEATTSSPVGKDGEFELAGLTPGRHRATITYRGGECIFDVEAPDGAGPVLDMGLVVCTQDGAR